MTVAFDAFSSSAVSAANPLTWTHTPVGQPRAAIVQIVNAGASSPGDMPSSVSYGGFPMAEVPGSPSRHTTGELGAVSTWFLGTGLPAGPVTVLAFFGSGVMRRAASITLTADDETEVVASDGSIHADSLVDPSVTLALGHRACFGAIGFHSGQDAVSGVSPLVGWTDRLEHAFGAVVAAWYTLDGIRGGDLQAGWLQTADDATMVALAVSELLRLPSVAPAAPSLGVLPLQRTVRVRR